MRLPIDTRGISFIAAHEPNVALDYDSRAPKTAADGQVLFQLRVAALGDTDSEVIVVRAPGDPKGIAKGTAVRLTGLVANPWTMADRHGVSFTADRIEVLAATPRVAS